MEDTVAYQLEIVYGEMVLEILNSATLSTVVYYIYKGIEISHPVYALIFCDLILTLISSLINVVIFPFLNTHQYTILANGNCTICLVVQCCCWCIISFLRYMYITKQTWLENKFPDYKQLIVVSLSGLCFLVLISLSSTSATFIYFGYPEVKVIKAPLEHKIIVSSVLLLNLAAMILVSCWCYFEIMRQRGKLGQNSVHAINAANSSEVMPAELFIIENVHRHLSAGENIEMQTFAAIQMQTEMKKRQAEIDSAMISLKTNLSFIIFLIFYFLLAAFLSSDALAGAFPLFKGQVYVLAYITNLEKIRALLFNPFEYFCR
jgi:hypothetical protein